MTLLKFLNYVRFRLEAEIIKVVPVDKGRLKGSINVLFINGEMVIKMVDYGLLVEYGTAKMINAHGPHDPDDPVTDWEALRKRGGSGQTMPFIRNTLYHKLPEILHDGASRFLNGANVELTFS